MLAIGLALRCCYEGERHGEKHWYDCSLREHAWADAKKVVFGDRRSNDSNFLIEPFSRSQSFWRRASL